MASDSQTGDKYDDSYIEENQRMLDLLWGARSEPRRGPKPSLDVERIVQVAAAVADAEGLGAVSMQRIARECGVTTMALYRYVPGKAELVALMLDIGLGVAPALNGAPGDWRAKLEDWAQRLWAVFAQHPWSLAATAPARVMGPNEARWFEIAVGALASTSLPADEALQAVIAILLHVRGMVASSLDAGQEGRLTPGGWGASVTYMLRRHGSAFPALAAAQRAGAFDRPTVKGDRLGLGLRLLFDGINARIEERAREHAI